MRPIAGGWALGSGQVKDAMTHLVVTVRPDETILAAATVLSSNRISGAPVVDGGKVVGVVSETDLVRAVSPPPRHRSLVVPQPLMLLLVRGTAPREAGDLRVGDVMTTRVVSVEPDASIWTAAELIDRHGVRRLPVVDPEGNLVGVLARSDLVRCMALGGRGVAEGLQGLPSPA